LIHSPFHTVENFISPLQCEIIADRLKLNVPSYAEDGQPLKYECRVPVELAGNIASELDALSPLLERRYGAQISAEPALLFQQYWENAKAPAEQIGCENSKFSRKKWIKTKDVDLVGFIWLKSFHNSVPLDPRHEVYGGKLEFPGYNFSLTPVRGTLVIFPATPHFITATSHVMLGSLEQIKLNIKLKDWQYQPESFPGTYQEWFFPEE
jgi:hypothetical protein